MPRTRELETVLRNFKLILPLLLPIVAAAQVQGSSVGLRPWQPEDLSEVRRYGGREIAPAPYQKAGSKGAVRYEVELLEIRRTVAAS